MAGALKTLFGALQSSSFMQGVSFAFGEEFITALEAPAPYVVMVPVGGQIDNNPGYVKGMDPAVEMAWGIHEQVDFYLWGESTNPQALPVDHADAVETLRQQVLSAMRDQQAQYSDAASVSYGLSWKPVSERWLTDRNATIRAGRCVILTCTPEISVPMAVPSGSIATVTSEQITYTVNNTPP